MFSGHPASPRYVSSSVPDTGKGTVLVVDDEPIIRRMVQNILHHFQYRVISAENGQKAIDLLTDGVEPIDVMLLDVSMPVMSGQTALEHIRKIRPDLAVIVSSGLDENNVEARFSGLAVTSFIRKPYSMQTLVDAISAAVSRPKVAGSGA